MKTLGDHIKKITHDITPLWWRRFKRDVNDVICFFFGHKWQYLSDIFGNFRGANVCRRCNRYEKFLHSTLNKTSDEFYHNWETKWGTLARCHDHSK